MNDPLTIQGPGDGAPAAGVLQPVDRDAMIRTVIAEGGSSPDGWGAVANTIKNRLATGKFGATPAAVVTAPGQFEVWSDGSAQKVDPSSPTYAAAGRVVDAVAAGQAPDNSGGATHFFSPSGQAARAGDGRQQVPGWAKNQTASVGGNVFFAPEGKVTYQGQGGATPGPAPAPVSFGGQQNAPDPSPLPASAPETSAAPQPAATSPDDVALLSRWGVQPSGAAATAPASNPTTSSSAPTPAPAATPSSDDAAFLSRWGVAPKPADAAPVSFGGPETASGGADKGALLAGAANFLDKVPLAGPALLDLANKAGAETDHLFKGQGYDDALAARRANVAATTAAHPIASTVGGVGGAIAGMAPALEAAPGLLGAAGTLGERMLMGSASGAAIGGADAAVRGDNPLTGAAFGGAGGVAGPLAGNAIGTLASKGANALLDAGGTAANLIRTGASSGLPGYSRSAANLLTKAAEFDGGGNALMTGAQALGPDATMMDVGPSMKGLALGMTKTPSEAKSVVENFANARAAGSDDRVMNALGATIGPDRDPQMIADGIEAARTQAANEAYSQIHAAAPPVDAGPVLKVIDDHLEHATGEQAKALLNIRKTLTTLPPSADAGDSAFVRTAGGDVPVGEPPAHLDEAPFSDPSATMTAPPSPGVPRPQSLAQFVRAAGGIQDQGGDLKSMGLDKLIAKPGQGLGPDAMRQAAAQAGYLSGSVGGGVDDAARFSTIGDLHNALEDADRVYSVHDDDALHAWDQHDQAKAAYQRQQADSDGISRSAAPPNAPGLGFGGPDVDPNPADALQSIRTDSRGLHNLRMDIDNVIENDKPGLGVPSGAVSKRDASVVAVRQALDDVLKTVPGMRQADAAFAHSADVQNALAQGHDKVLGALGPHPDSFALQRAGMDPDVAQAQNIGIAGKVYRTFGTGTQRDAVKLGKLLAGGEDGYNTRNLQTAFGEEPVNALLGTVARERAFADTTNKIAQSSVTARVQGGAKMLEDAEPGSTNLLNASLTGVGLQTAKSALVDPLVKAIMANPDAPLASEVARALTAQGATRDEVLTQLARLGSQRGAITSGSNALLQIGNRAGQAAASGAGETNRTPSIPFTNALTGR